MSAIHEGLTREIAVNIRISHAYEEDVAVRGDRSVPFRNFPGKSAKTIKVHLKCAEEIVQTWVRDREVPENAARCLRILRNRPTEQFLAKHGLRYHRDVATDTLSTGGGSGARSDLSSFDDGCIEDHMESGNCAPAAATEASSFDDGGIITAFAYDASASFATFEVHPESESTSTAAGIKQPEKDRNADKSRHMHSRGFNELFRDFCISGRGRYDIDKFLKELHRHRPKIDYTALPKCAKTIFRMKKNEQLAMASFAVRAMKSQKDFQPATESDDESSDDNILRSGSYLHLGLERALLGESPGLYHFGDHISMLRRVEAVSPGILPEYYLKLAYGEELTWAEQQVASGAQLPAAYNWYDPSLHRPTSLLFSLNIHVDGVQVYDNSEKSEAMPILASVHELIPYDATLQRAHYDKGTMLFYIKMLKSSIFNFNF